MLNKKEIELLHKIVEADSFHFSMAYGPKMLLNLSIEVDQEVFEKLLREGYITNGKQSYVTNRGYKVLQEEEDE